MRVVVAMSGGVDSAVAAALLKRQGHDVVAVTYRLSDEELAVSRCCSEADVQLARRTAAGLGIAHHVRDLSPAFRSRVVEPFVASYLAGETPLPCARCNALVKFSQLMELAGEVGADAVATGHYARLGRDAEGQPTLLRGVFVRPALAELGPSEAVNRIPPSDSEARAVFSSSRGAESSPGT